MAATLEEPLKTKWIDIRGQEVLYGFLSTFSHPRWRAISILLDPERKVLSIGPTYDYNLFIVTANYLLHAGMRVMEFLYRLVAPIAPDWIQESQPVLNQAQECRKELLETAKALLADSPIT